MITIDGLSKSFGDVHAVRDVSFAALDGQITGLLGPNGAGKTTTLRMLSSLLKPDRGRALVDDVNVHEHPRDALSRIGILPDSRGLYPRLTAREHLEYFGSLQGMSGDRIASRIGDLTGLLGMEHIIDRRVEGFSQGERTKVAIGRALIHSPNNVVLDEATNGLDVMSARSVRAAVRSLAEDGACVLFSSHLMEEVASLCDRIIVFREGELVADGTAAELLEQTESSDLEDAFVALAGGEQS
jgi:sodium transport system ATP-binding protein